MTAAALRQHVTPRYIHMLFQTERITFSEFVLGQRLIVAGHHVDAEASIRNVGVGEAGEDGDRDHAGIALQGLGEIVEPSHGPARRALVAEILSGIGLSDPAHGSAMLLALEDGFRLHRLIDPASTPADSFVRSIGELQKLRAAKN